MSESNRQSEDRLMSLLQQGLDEADPVPTDVTDFARAALSWRTIDAELAQLAYDSSEESTSAGVRSAATARMLSFEVGTWMIDIEYNAPAGSLMGQIEPAPRLRSSCTWPVAPSSPTPTSWDVSNSTGSYPDPSVSCSGPRGISRS